MNGTGNGTAVVALKSASASKINWLNLIGLAVGVGSYFGVDMDEDTQAAVAVGIGAITQVGSWVLRTWFTNTVTPSSVGR